MADKVSTIKTIFALDGERTYRNAVRDINTEQKLLRSELSLATAKLSDQGDKAGVSRAKIDSLNKQIELQKRKVNEARHAVEQSTEKWGEADERVLKYKTDLNYAESALYRLEGQLKSANEELAKQESRLVQVGDKLQSAGSKMQDYGDKMDRAGDKLSKNVTAPLMLGAGYAAKVYMDFETAATGVAKTVDMTAEEFEVMKNAIREMAIELPGSTEDIAGLAEVAGQLGVQNEHILDFVEVMTRLGVSSNLAGEEGATMLARYANITKMPQSEFERLSSTIVALGNNTATSEKEIMDMGMRLAAAGSQAGLTDPEIMALAASLSSVGLEAQAGGSAMSKAISRIQLEVETGGDALADFARIAGMTTEEFSVAFEQDALGAIMAFVGGLSNMDEHGASAIQLLDELGLTEIRTRDSLLRLTNAQDMVNEAIDTANNAWAENTALRAESDMFMQTQAQQLEKERDRLKDVAITLGAELLPHLVDFTAYLAKAAQAFNNLDPEQQKMILKLLAITAAAGPVLKITGSLTKGVGSLTEGIGKFIAKSGEKAAIEGVSAAMGTGPGGLATAFSVLNPLMIVAAGGLALFVAQALDGPSKIEVLQDKIKDFSDGVIEQMDRLNQAGSAFDGFAGGISFSSEKMGELDRQIRETHTNIIEIARTAAEENRALTEEERQALEELTELLTRYTEEKLKSFREQQSAYRTFAENEKVETDAHAASLINGAQDAAEQTINVAKSMYQESLRLADEMYGERGSKDKQAHQEAIEQAQNRYENEIELAEKTRVETVQSVVDKWNDVNVSGLEFKENYSTLLNELQTLEDERERKLSESTGTERSIFGQRDKIQADFVKKRADLTQQLIDLFDDESNESLKSWVAMNMFAQVHGATLSSEHKKTMSSIMQIMQELPPEARKQFEEMMLGAIDGIVEKNPEVASQAELVKRNVLSALKNGYWDAHSSGQSIGQGLQDGIWSKLGDVVSTTQSMAGSVRDTYRRVLTIQSPSKAMFEDGANTAEGVILGIKSKLPELKRAGEMMGEGVRSSVDMSEYGSRLTVPSLPQPAKDTITRQASNNQEMLQILRDIRDKDATIVMSGKTVARVIDKRLGQERSRL